MKLITHEQEDVDIPVKMRSTPLVQLQTGAFCGRCSIDVNHSLVVSDAPEVQGVGKKVPILINLII